MELKSLDFPTVLSGYKKPPVHHGDTISVTADGRFLIETVPVAINAKVTGSELPNLENKDLVNLGPYFPFCRRGNLYVTPDDYDHFVNDYPDVIGNWDKLKRLHNAIQEHNKVNDTKKDFPYDLYYLTLEHPLNNERYVQPFLWFRSNPSGTKGIVFHTELNDLYCPSVRSAYKKDNMKIIRFMHEGDPNEPLTCKFSGKCVENLSITWNDGYEETVGNAFDLHHMLVVNRESVRKLGTDPAKLICTMDLTKDSNKDSLIDILGTTVASKDYHSVVHKDCTQGIERYKDSQKPWALRNEENFVEFCNVYDLELEYDEFIFSHTLASLSKG